MSEFRFRILRNVGIAALIFGTVFSLSLYASLNLTGLGIGTSSATSTSSFSTVTMTPPSSSTSGKSTLTSTTATSTSLSFSTNPSCAQPSVASSTNSTASYAVFPVGSVLKRIPLVASGATGGEAFDPQNNMLYVTGSNYFGSGFGGGNSSNMLFIINGATEQNTNDTIPAGNQPVDIIYDPDNGYLYVADYGSNSVSVINPNSSTIVKNISVGVTPVKLAYNPHNKEVYVTNRGSHSISVLNASSNTPLATIPFEGSPFALAYDALNYNMYVTDGSNNTLTVINSFINQVAERLEIGQTSSPGMTAGMMIAYDSANTNIYVTGYGGAAAVYAISSSTNKIVGNVSTNIDPNAMAYDPANKDIYVAGNASGGFLIAISSENNSIVSSVSGGGYTPLEIIPNSPANTAMYLSADSAVYVLSNFANRTLVTNTQQQTSTTMWEGYRLPLGCAATIAVSYYFPDNFSGTQPLHLRVEPWGAIGNNNSWFSSCFPNGSLIPTCPGISASVAPQSLHFYQGLNSTILLTINASSSANPGAYIVNYPGVSCPVMLLIVGNQLPASVRSANSECLIINNFFPTIQILNTTNLYPVQLPVSG